MDLSTKGLSAEQTQSIHDFIIKRKLLYQPYRFSEDLEVGAGQHFILNTEHQTIHWKNHDPRSQESITGDVAHYREHNAHLRSIYDYFLDTLRGNLGDLSQIDFAEVGCNTGYFLFGLALRGARRCIGFDFTPNQDVFKVFNEILGTHCEFHFAEWDSLAHRLNYATMPEVDVSLSVAVTCHLADAVHHLAYLCDHSRKAVFLWCPVNDATNLSISFGNPARYPNALGWPLSFDNDIRFSIPLLRLCLTEAGFGDIREVHCPSFLPPTWQGWYRNQKGYLAFRTEEKRTALSPNGGKRSRDIPSEIVELYPELVRQHTPDLGPESKISNGHARPGEAPVPRTGNPPHFTIPKGLRRMLGPVRRFLRRVVRPGS